MPGTIGRHLSALADSLADLRGRLREAARIEVARTIGEALREATHSLIVGPSRRSASVRPAPKQWDESWDPDDDPWEESVDFREPISRKTPFANASRAPLALSAGFGVARWTFARSGQVVPAMALGVTIAGISYFGGPLFDVLLDVVWRSHDLLDIPDQSGPP